MNPTIIYNNLNDIEDVLIKIKNEENEEAVDYCLDKIKKTKVYL